MIKKALLLLSLQLLLFSNNTESQKLINELKSIDNYIDALQKASISEKSKEYDKSTLFYKIALSDLLARLNDKNIKTFTQSSTSMSPTIRNKDTLLAIRANKVKRGDIVIFPYPVNPKIFYMKRCIATGGDLVGLKDKNLLLHIKEGNDFIKKNFPKDSYIEFANKLWLVNPYKRTNPSIHNDLNVIKNGKNPQQIFDMVPVEIPQNSYFVMGDNRDHSNDSRFWGEVKSHNLFKPIVILNSNDKDKEGMLLNNY